jgi:hypothetical protein
MPLEMELPPLDYRTWEEATNVLLEEARNNLNEESNLAASLETERQKQEGEARELDRYFEEYQQRCDARELARELREEEMCVLNDKVRTWMDVKAFKCKASPEFFKDFSNRMDAKPFKCKAIVGFFKDFSNRMDAKKRRAKERKLLALQDASAARARKRKARSILREAQRLTEGSKTDH